ncbi:MAG: imidazole glycerol phosphate synthase subunit HisH [Planctomycetota bacterium]|nr:imidazole glycerol phosphate synthase subunit HisH [Planctomycetota bacterium]
MIAVVDYGLGNLKSVACAFARCGADVRVTSDPRDIAAAAAVVLPGVGAFEKAMGNLRRLGLLDPVREAAAAATAGGRPFLGICLGLQLLFEKSFEHGEHGGLAVLPGIVARFAAGLKVPHMGWNRVRQNRGSPLFDGIEDWAYFYFAHSYRAEPARADLTLGETDYGGAYASAVSRGTLFALQFHPEKSGGTGLKMIRNFLRMAEERRG